MILVRPQRLRKQTTPMMLSLTFDDGLAQHLDEAVPVLDDHGLRETSTHAWPHPRLRGVWRTGVRRRARVTNWAITRISHPADQRKSWVREGNALDLYSLDRMRMELETANLWLTAIDGCGPARPLLIHAPIPSLAGGG